MADYLYKEDNNICFIKGISLSDLLSEVDNTKKSDTPIKEVDYDPLPDEFIDIYSWTKKSNLFCMYCCHQFESIPVRMPIGMTSYGSFKLEGIYCCFNCCISYLTENNKYNDNRWDIIEMLRIMYSKYYGKKVVKIFEAPVNMQLKIFGGTVDISEFRRTIETLQSNEDCSILTSDPGNTNFDDFLFNL